MKDEVNKWLKFAQDDIKMASLAVGEGLFNQVCFHSQQAAEKLLKGLIIYKGKKYAKIHSLTELMKIVDEQSITALRDDLLYLDQFYMPSRYPDALPGTLPSGLPNKQDAVKAFEIINKVRDTILKIID